MPASATLSSAVGSFPGRALFFLETGLLGLLFEFGQVLRSAHLLLRERIPHAVGQFEVHLPQIQASVAAYLH